MKTGFYPIIALLAALLLGGCGRDNPTLEAPTATAQGMSVAITSPEDGAQIAGNVVLLTAEAEGIEIAESNGNLAEGTGHFTVFIDRDPVATGETISAGPGVVSFADDTVAIPGLSIGKHKLTLVLADGSESRIGRSSSVVEVDVTGPSIDAMAPQNAPMAVGFTVETVATGVQIVDPARDAGQGGTGHLDLVIDPDEDPIGGSQPLPTDATHIHTTGTSTQVGGLGAGEHTVWVVLTDKNHVPVNPPVADRVIVTIR